MSKKLSKKVYQSLVILSVMIGFSISGLYAILIFKDTSRFDYAFLVFFLFLSIFCVCIWPIWRNTKARYDGKEPLAWWAIALAMSYVLLAQRWVFPIFGYLSDPESAAVRKQLQFGSVDVIFIALATLFFLVCFLSRKKNQGYRGTDTL